MSTKSVTDASRTTQTVSNTDESKTKTADKANDVASEKIKEVQDSLSKDGWIVVDKSKSKDLSFSLNMKG